MRSLLRTPILVPNKETRLYERDSCWKPETFPSERPNPGIPTDP